MKNDNKSGISLRLSKKLIIDLGEREEVFIRLLSYLSKGIILFYFMFVFLGYIFRFSTFAELNTIILGYLTIIILGVLQFIRIIIGGEDHFKKAPFDSILLALPPIIIIFQLIANGRDINSFGDETSWSFAPITLLIGIIVAYLTTINFLYKRGEMYLKYVFDIGLLVSSILLIFLNDSYLFEGSYSFLNYLLLLLIPYYILKLFLAKQFSEKLIALVIIIVGVYYYYDAIRDMHYLLDTNQFYRRYFKPQIILITLLYTLFSLAYCVIFIVHKAKNYKSELMRVKSILYDIEGKLLVDLKSILSGTMSYILFAIAFIFFISSSIWLFVTDYLEAFFNISYREWKEITNLTFNELMLGDNLALSYNHIMTIVKSYGMVVFGIFGIAISFIIISQLIKLFRNKFDIRSEIIQYTVAIGSISLFGFFFNFATIFYIAFWHFISLIIINSRDSDSFLNSYKISQINFIKDKQLQTILNYLRFAFIFFILIIAILIIRVLLSGINDGLFFTK